MIKVELKDSDLFKDIISVLKDVTEDERIPIDIRTEYKDKIKLIIEK